MSLTLSRQERVLKKLEAAFVAGNRLAHAQKLAELVRAGQDVLPGAWAAHPLGDDWREFAQDSLRQWFDTRAGYVYFVRVPSAGGSTLKVGQTRQNPWDRLRQLNHEVLSQRPRLEEVLFTHDRWWLEAQLHRELKARGTHLTKEHFRAETSAAVALGQVAHDADVTLFAKAGLPSLLTPVV